MLVEQVEHREPVVLRVVQEHQELRAVQVHQDRQPLREQVRQQELQEQLGQLVRRVQQDSFHQSHHAQQEI